MPFDELKRTRAVICVRPAGPRCVDESGNSALRPREMKRQGGEAPRCLLLYRDGERVKMTMRDAEETKARLRQLHEHREKAVDPNA